MLAVCCKLLAQHLSGGTEAPKKVNIRRYRSASSAFDCLTSADITPSCFFFSTQFSGSSPCKEKRKPVLWPQTVQRIGNAGLSITSAKCNSHRYWIPGVWKRGNHHIALKETLFANHIRRWYLSVLPVLTLSNSVFPLPIVVMCSVWFEDVKWWSVPLTV